MRKGDVDKRDNFRPNRRGVSDGPKFSECQQIALMRSIIARFDLPISTISAVAIATICNRSANPSTGAVGKPVRELIDRMLELEFLVEVPVQAHLYGNARWFKKGCVDLEEFKQSFAVEIAEYERSRHQERVFQHAV